MTDPYARMRASLLIALGWSPLAACGPTFEDTECVAVEADATECPSKQDVADQLLGQSCGFTTVRITGEGELSTDTPDTGMGGPRCCYPVLQREDTLSTCVVGRPYREGDAVVTAPRGAAPGWRAAARPKVRALPAETRRVLGEAWGREALVEHASVAAFGRISLELLAFGAPADLVRDAHAAAIDEVRHAQLCFGLAATYLGRAVAPGAFPLGAAVPLAGDLLALADATVREGCIAETLVALLDAEAEAHAADPAVRRALAVITRDEARHSRLAWRTLRWLLDVGGDPVRAVVARALADLDAGRFAAPTCTTGADPDLLLAHGRLSETITRRAWARGIAEVVRPALVAAIAPAPPTRASVDPPPSPAA